jgi:UDP-4-amino-4,6-dideoxy-N-acetyl-beta-L-altrosamine N-acetyltransferase
MLKPVTDRDIQTIFNWRNHPEVRKVMFTDHEISMAEHLAWWEKTRRDPAKKVYLFIFENQPVGVVNYYDIDAVRGACRWGFYLNNERIRDAAHRLKIWLALEKEAIEHAFDVLGCKIIYCETFGFNQQVLQIHRKFGFKEVESVLRKKNGREEQVIVMALEKTGANGTRSEEKKGGTAKPLRLAFLGSANWELIARDFAIQYEKTAGGKVEWLPLPFGQYRVQLSDGRSLLRNSELDYVVFCERFEDLLDSAFSVFDPTNEESVISRLDDYLELIRMARQHLGGVFLVLDFAPVRPISATLENSNYEEQSAKGFVNRLNARMRDFCRSMPDCHLIRLSALVESFGARNANPGKYWHLGRIAYPGAFGVALNNRLIQTILALQGRTARVLVVDLDNTLWGGVIGDDGIKGIKLGGDYPGSVFVEIQETIRALRNRGIALAICSKNTDSVALEAIRTHPGMRLRPEDFVVTRINWNDKASNIQEIADEIGVGLASVCLVDDSPYEREAIRQLLPQVIVPEMPADMTEWPAFLLEYPYLASLYLTKEDKERVERYKIRAQIKNEVSSFGNNKEEYWRSLNMRLHFHRFRDDNQQRVLQLLSKTNQFNMTTRRYTEADLARILTRGGAIVPVGLADKYSEQEIIGLVILQPSQDREATLVIDTFLLSCRVLGRSVETGILGWLCGFARTSGYKFLEGLFYETPRNLPASAVYRDHGFEDAGGGRFLLDLESYGFPVPDWFKVTDDLAK